jgi:hypothetical protein
MKTTIRLNAAKQRALAVCVAAFCTAAVPELSASVLAPPELSARVAMPPLQVLQQGPHTPAAIVTNCDDSGTGSLRDALAAAVDGDFIDLAQMNCSTISLTTGSLVLNANDVALVGPADANLTIDASGSAGYAVIYDVGGGTLHLRNMTLTGGSKYRSDNTAHGGCVYAFANLDMGNVIVNGCSARSNGGSALGGGVFAGGQLYMKNSTVTQSHTRATVYASGGGVYALGGLTMVYSSVSHSYCYSETSTPGFGGGVFARGPALIIGSTVSDSSAIRMGGVALADNGGIPATIINSTISGNTALEIGGIFVRQQLNIYNSTIAFNNSSIWTDGASYFAAGLYITVPGEMDSTIIANNVNSTAPFATADLTGAPGAGFNGGNNNVMFCGTACPTDTSHEDPGLHPLQDNGGFTKTHVPTPGIWDTFGGTNVLNQQWDQRGPGFPRQSPGDWPEIGALQINSDIIFANGFN